MGRCAWQGCFAVQSGHGVIVSISDGLRACQAAVFGFRGIAREPARLSPSLPVLRAKAKPLRQAPESRLRQRSSRTLSILRRKASRSLSSVAMNCFALGAHSG